MMTTEKLYEMFLSSEGICTDSRKLFKGCLFFALKGENFDGNAYAAEALEKGAVAAVVTAGSQSGSGMIEVEDTLVALKELAAWHRLHVGGAKRLPVVGLTGTNGKTTTKELVRTALAAGLKVSATEGNLNNEIGVPLSVLAIKPGTEVAVIEMGASHPEDLKPLLAVSDPDFGLITNVGKAHLEGFGSFDGVKRAKGMLYDHLAANGGTVLLNGDDPVLSEMAAQRGLKPVLYGVKTQGCTVLAPSPEHPYLRIDKGGRIIQTHLVGSYNAPNVRAAIATAVLCGVPEEDAIKAIEAYVPSNNRSEMARTARNTVIEDFYNANPSSMAAALENFASVEAPRKSVLLGDMRELGPDSVSEHVAIIKRLMAMTLSGVFLVGEEFGKAMRECNVPASWCWFKTSDELADYLSGNPIGGEVLLVKGSRGIRMEKVLPQL